MDRHRNDRSGATTYWVRGGELLNVWIARYEPHSAAFEQEEGDWFPVGREEILREVGEAERATATILVVFTLGSDSDRGGPRQQPVAAAPHG